MAGLVMALSEASRAQARQFDPLGQRSSSLYLAAGLAAHACGDLDGDGDLDVAGVTAAVGFSGANVVVYRRQGATWQQQVVQALSVPPAAAPRALAVQLADLDVDGDLDLLVTLARQAAPRDIEVRLLRNDGTGTFTAAATLVWPAIVDARAVVGDLDGDGDLDLVAARHDAANQPLPLLVLSHDGNFGFQPAAATTPGTAAKDVALADLEGDGDLDLVVVDASAQVLAWYNTAGNFGGGLLWAGPARTVFGADCDGDLDVDLIAQSSTGAITLLRNLGGTFSAQTVTTGGTTAGQRPEPADFDGDGATDLGMLVDGELRILRNDGAGNFTAERLCGATGFSIGDADLDGRDDVLLALGTDGSGGIAIARGAAGRMAYDAALQSRNHVALATSGTTEAAADLDRDGRVDWIQSIDYGVLVRRNHGAGNWSTTQLQTARQRAMACPADLDGDGDLDLVCLASSQPGGIQVFRHDPGFQFTPLPLQFGLTGRSIDVGDFDGDGRDDVLVIASDNSVQLLRSSGTGAFATPSTLFVGMHSSARPGIWDWEGDGDLDILVVTGFPYCGLLLTNDGAGNFSTAASCTFAPPLGWGAVLQMQIADFDGDGDADLFLYSYGGGTILLDLAGTFVPVQVLQGATGSSLWKPLLADWDDDGDVDILQLGGTAQLWLNVGNGTFVDATAQRIGHVTFQATVAADLDGDGDVDPVGFFGTFQAHRQNHLRSATSLQAPALGSHLRIRFASEPGFAAANTACLPILAFAPRSSPLAVAGIRGTWQLDPSSAMVLPLLNLPAPTGTAELSMPIPLQPAFLGIDLHAQGLVLGTAAAFTPAVHERIVP
ncbi:MAG: VCBS repeat-containing protein [Planctomycetes bacterium]|nr:VCBS repeat-containing protein [Planctomycetota bacterium]